MKYTPEQHPMGEVRAESEAGAGQAALSGGASGPQREPGADEGSAGESTEVSKPDDIDAHWDAEMAKERAAQAKPAKGQQNMFDDVTNMEKADAAAEPLKSSKPQKEPGGMFSNESDQTDIADFTKPAPTVKGAAKSALMDMDEVFKGLNELFGGTKPSSGLAFDDDPSPESNIFDTGKPDERDLELKLGKRRTVVVKKVEATEQDMREDLLCLLWSSPDPKAGHRQAASQMISENELLMPWWEEIRIANSWESASTPEELILSLLPKRER